MRKPLVKINTKIYGKVIIFQEKTNAIIPTKMIEARS